MKKTLFILLILLLFNIPAEPLESVEFLSGYLRAELSDNQGAYSGTPLLVSFNFRSPAFPGEKEHSRWEFAAEPFVSYINRPEKSTEGGLSFLLKYDFLRDKPFTPYVKFGMGAAYITRGTISQSAGFNFLPQAGAGIGFSFRDNTSLTFEYRYRHLSNAGTGGPNAGIDAHMVLAGVRFAL